MEGKKKIQTLKVKSIILVHFLITYFSLENSNLNWIKKNVFNYMGVKVLTILSHN